MGFFTDAYDLFCITTVSKLLGRLYYHDPHANKPGKLHSIKLRLQILLRMRLRCRGCRYCGCYPCSELSAANWCSVGSVTNSAGRKCMGLLSSSWCFAPFARDYRGDYPLSATIMSEYANKKTRGVFIAAVFAMQGVGIIFAGLVSMILSGVFLKLFPAPTFKQDQILSTCWNRSIHRDYRRKCETRRPIWAEFSTWNSTWNRISQNLTQKDIFPAMGLTNKAPDVNAIREVFETSRAMFVVALLGTFPGDHNKFLFVVLYGLTFFFANFGPNSTTFVLPAELFPIRVRSTCHTLNAASGKANAMIGAFVVQTYTLDEDVKKIKTAIIALAFTNLLGFCFTFLVPETKGRSLEEISGGWWRRRRWSERLKWLPADRLLCKQMTDLKGELFACYG
ncbi:Inorganic phosphate transporter 1-11 [Hibiscus syriacus]|uniref:Inorganic phosphate transporter 1-11 n=1 Tax=Hibiscus syriacus TaxID=106335 RepID=A0A6A2WQM5_HIBSY|nr:Inorganic phosphate transporter 1-11 [Hibiscus syriacus]